MDNLINTTNSIGKSIAFTKMIMGFCFACCICSVGGLFLTNKNERRKNVAPAATLFSMGLCVAFISYLIYDRASQRGMGTVTALNAGLRATGLGRMHVS